MIEYGYVISTIAEDKTTEFVYTQYDFRQIDLTSDLKDADVFKTPEDALIKIKKMIENIDIPGLPKYTLSNELNAILNKKTLNIDKICFQRIYSIDVDFQELMKDQDK